MNPKFHNLTVKEIRRETADAVSISLEVPSELENAYQYKPGQYLTFKKIINDEELRRSYSICAGLHENELRVAVKRIPDGRFSNFANTILKVGDEIEVMTPLGTFTTDFDKDTAKDYLFFAGGSGITPVMALVKTILHTAPNSKIYLVYGNRGYEHIIFREEIDKLLQEYAERFEVLHVFSDEKNGNALQEGLLNEAKIKELNTAIFQNRKIDEVFVCGPQPMILAVRDVFEAEGLSKEQIHFELFANPDQNKESEETPKAENTHKNVIATVTAIIDDDPITVELATNGKSILDAVNDAGGDAPYSCKGGVCSTCKAKVLEGEVFMDKNFALEEDEVEDGYILTCQSHPITENVTVSYDEW